MLKSLLSKALVCIALTAACLAQVAVNAHITGGDGKPVAGSFLRFELWNCGPNFPILTAVNNYGAGGYGIGGYGIALRATVIVQRTVDLKANGSGLVSGSIFPNDQIFCGNTASTRWLVTAMKDAATPLNATERYNITALGGTFDPATANPDVSSPPNPIFSLVLQNPLANQQVAQPAGTSFTFKGNVDFTLATVTGLPNTGGGGGSTFPDPVPVANGGTGNKTPGTVTGSLCYFTPTAFFCDQNALLDGLGHLNAATINANSFTIGGAGAGVLTFTTGTGIAAPSAGKAVLYVDSGTGLLTCLLNASVNCAPSGGGSFTPPGSNQQLLFNDAGAAGAATGLLWNKSTSTLTIPGGSSFSSLASNVTDILYPANGQWVYGDNSGNSSPFMQIAGSTSGFPSLLMGSKNGAGTLGSLLSLLSFSNSYMGHTFSNGLGFFSDVGAHHGFAVDGSTGVQYMDRVTLLGGTGNFFDASALSDANAFKVPVQAGATATADGAIAYDSTSKHFHASVNGVDKLICTTAGELGCGGGSGSGAGGGAGVGFTAQTSVTIAGTTHNIGSKNLLVQCYDNASPANSIQPSTYTVNGSTFDVIVTFASAQTGYCVVSGLGPAKYSTGFTAVTTVTVTGATHALGRADLTVTMWDNSSPRQRIEPASVTVNSSTFDVVATFAAAQTGTIVIQ